MSEDPVVLFVVGVHGPPGEGVTALEVGRVRGERGELPGGALGGAVAGPHRVPGRLTEIPVPGDPGGRDQGLHESLGQ
ncbi:hypothetical protein ACWDBP_13805 [Streptomyces sp. NPDC001233]|uniref:hypothetical protein n=1 Tax=Streptomyces sp. NPDC001127 TaxID=3154377 RepID=UPI00331C64CF